MTTPAIRDKFLLGQLSRDEALTELMHVGGGRSPAAGRMVDRWGGLSYVAHFNAAAPSSAAGL